MIGKTLLAGVLAVSAVFAAPDSHLPGATLVDMRLAEAAMSGNAQAAEALLHQKANVNGAQGDGMTALHWAAYRGDLKLVQELLQAEAGVNVGTRVGGITPLLLASQGAGRPVVEALLKAGADPNEPNGNGTTPLMMAAASGHADVVATLLDYGALVNRKEFAHGQTALMFAASLNRTAAIKVLMDHGADASVLTKVVQLERPRFDKTGNVIAPGQKTEEDSEDEDSKDEKKPVAKNGTANSSSDGHQPVTAVSVAHAVSAPAVGSTKEADRHAALNAKPPEKKRRDFGATTMGGMTALLFAARDGQMQAVRSLLDAGANINQVSGAEKLSPLVIAISNGHYDVAQYLIDRGADPNLATIQGLTALYAVVDVQWAPHGWSPVPITDQEKVGYLQLMKSLLAHGAKPNARLGKKVWSRTLSQDGTWVDAAGATAYWRAAQATDKAAMELLVAGDADPNLATTAGVTPLMVASGLGWAPNFSINAPGSWMSAIEYCLEKSSNINAADEKGYTALHGAAFVGNNELVSFLIGKGAKTNAKTKAGDTVADMANGPIAHSIPHPETVALLEKAGSPNSHNCRSDQCVVAPKEDKKPVVAAAAKAPAKPGSR